MYKVSRTHFSVQLIISTVHELLESHVHGVQELYKVSRTHLLVQLMISTVHVILESQVQGVQNRYSRQS